MYHVQKQAQNDSKGKLELLGKAPRRNQDYVPQKVLIQTWLRRLISLPCDVIVTGHLYGIYETIHLEDGTTEERLVKYRFLSTGKATVVIPLEFSELWVMVPKPTPTGVTVELITNLVGMYQGSTRIGRDGKFNVRETPNIKALLRKAGWPTTDKDKLL